MSQVNAGGRGVWHFLTSTKESKDRRVEHIARHYGTLERASRHSTAGGGRLHVH